MSRADGQIDSDEASELLVFVRRSNLLENLSAYEQRQLLSSVSEEDLVAASRVLSRLKKEDARRLVLQMAVGIAITDGYLTFGENHILRFLTDLLQLSPTDLTRLYYSSTGQELPEPGDPSSMDWWKTVEMERKRRENTERQDRKAGSDRQRRKSRSGLGREMSPTRAFAVLGLEHGASQSEIKSAYRRLARVHHPDRYEQLGPEAVEAATVTFQRIQIAYETLTD